MLLISLIFILPLLLTTFYYFFQDKVIEEAAFKELNKIRIKILQQDYSTLSLLIKTNKGVCYSSNFMKINDVIYFHIKDENKKTLYIYHNNNEIKGTIVVDNVMIYSNTEKKLGIIEDIRSTPQNNTVLLIIRI